MPNIPETDVMSENAGQSLGQSLGQTAAIGPAQSAHLRIVQIIRAFESQLDASQEVAMGFAGSDAGILRIEGVGFYDPDLITFYGRDEAGQKTQLIQHIAQLSLMLRAAPVANAAAPARRIGFVLQAGWAGGDAGDASA